MGNFHFIWPCYYWSQISITLSSIRDASLHRCDGYSCFFKPKIWAKSTCCKKRQDLWFCKICSFPLHYNHRHLVPETLKWYPYGIYCTSLGFWPLFWNYKSSSTTHIHAHTITQTYEGSFHALLLFELFHSHLKHSRLILIKQRPKNQLLFMK